MKSDADAFRKRAKECRDVANGTKDPEAQRELRVLAEDLEKEASEIDEGAAKPDLSGPPSE